ncbi:hypothetical protein HN51_050296 [Arachis hypogaea]
MASDWSIVDSGTARLLAWDTCCDRFAILESAIPPRLPVLPKGSSSKRAREAAAVASSASVQVHILLYDGTSNILMRSVDLFKAKIPVYIGDDRTDEDAFKKLRDRGQGLGILVSKFPEDTNASYSLQNLMRQKLVMYKAVIQKLIMYKAAAAITAAATPAVEGSKQEQKCSSTTVSKIMYLYLFLDFLM